MHKKLTPIYTKSSKISRSSSNVPLYDGKQRCDGLHKKMKSTFCPWRTWKTQPKHGSSKTKGKMIHRQVQHFYSCRRKNECICGLKRFKVSKYLVAIANWLKNNNIAIDDAELPIYSSQFNTITWVDLVGHFTYNPDSIVKISLKTSHTKAFYSDHHGLSFEKMGEYRIPCSTTNLHHMQSLCEDIMMTQDGCKPNTSFTLYAYKKVNEDTEQSSIECKREDYPMVFREVRARNYVAKALTTENMAVDPIH